MLSWAAVLVTGGLGALMWAPSLLAHPPGRGYRLDSEGPNDGPALRKALVPVAGADASFQSALGWPADASANPCEAPLWRGISCSAAGRVEAIDFRKLRSREALRYTLNGPALLQLTSTCSSLSLSLCVCVCVCVF